MTEDVFLLLVRRRNPNHRIINLLSSNQDNLSEMVSSYSLDFAENLNRLVQFNGPVDSNLVSLHISYLRLLTAALCKHLE